MPVAVLLSGCAAPIIAAPLDPATRDQIVAVPVKTSSGETVPIPARLCRPAGDTPARVVVINHGSPVSAADRPQMIPGRCTQAAARWFLDRGFVVMFPLRRGYGANGGAWAEGSASCDSADYTASGVETARDINAAVDYATALPFVRPTGAVVVGQSAGGWGVIAYDSEPHPKVSAFVDMAGGRGGHYRDRANSNCHSERLIAAAGRFGATASTPMLWVYAANDSFFAPPIAEAMHAAFTGSGGRATLIQPGPFRTDGHMLFFGPGGSAIWGKLVDAYFEERGIRPALDSSGKNP